MSILPQAPDSIAILRLSAIGDVTHVVPLISAIQEQYPQTTITWIIGKAEYQLVNDISGIEFIIYDKRSGIKGLRAFRNTVKNRHFDVLFHMQAALRASILSLFIKAPIKIGFDKARAIDKQWLFSNHKIDATAEQHVLDGFAEFGKKIGVPTQNKTWNIPIPQDALLFAEQHIEQNKPLFVINACSSARANNFRNWSVDNYSVIAQYVIEKYNMQVILTGGPNNYEKSFAQKIEQACSRKVTNLVGLTSLKQMLAILSKATITLSPDTGPAHMANAAGSTVIGLYVTSNPARTGPYSNLQWVVNKYPDAVKHFLNKDVSEVKWGQRVREANAMDLISTKDVIEKIDNVLKH